MTHPYRTSQKPRPPSWWHRVVRAIRRWAEAQDRRLTSGDVIADPVRPHGADRSRPRAWSPPWATPPKPQFKPMRKPAKNQRPPFVSPSPRVDQASADEAVRDIRAALANLGRYWDAVFEPGCEIERIDTCDCHREEAP